MKLEKFGIADISAINIYSMQQVYQKMNVKEILEKDLPNGKDRMAYIGSLMILGRLLMLADQGTGELIYGSNQAENIYSKMFEGCGIDPQKSTEWAKTINAYASIVSTDKVIKAYLLELEKAHDLNHVWDKVRPNDIDFIGAMNYDVYHHPVRSDGYYDESPVESLVNKAIMWWCS